MNKYIVVRCDDCIIYGCKLDQILSLETKEHRKHSVGWLHTQNEDGTDGEAWAVRLDGKSRDIKKVFDNFRKNRVETLTLLVWGPRDD